MRYTKTKRKMKLRYFKLSEFDSPLEKGSGKNMDLCFLEMLDNARGFAGVPFKINSGFRVPADTQRLINQGYKAVKDSPHLKGYAADIRAENSTMRYKIITACLKAGFTRMGIGKNFIHVDNDPDKAQHLIWHYYD